MVYRTPEAERLYVCRGCGSPEPAPARGGEVACSRCQAEDTLPDRGALPARGFTPMPAEDAARLQHLRAQVGQPRLGSPTLQAVLGGTRVLPGREEEALVIWQSLRARARQGDVAASEDMSTLTLMLARLPGVAGRPELVEALAESAFDAAVLPRHGQEQLGKLSRRAAGQGDRAGAARYLGWMTPRAADLESDSELRLSEAALATLDGDGVRVRALLGSQKGDVPIADSLDPLASVLRANAYEMLGDAAGAAQILRELGDPADLAMVSASFPSLRLCARSAPVFGAAAAEEAAARASAEAGRLGTVVGGILALSGLVAFIIMAANGDLASDPSSALVGGVLLVTGAALVVRARRKSRRAAWLRLHGLSLTARITAAETTGTTINDVPVHRFSLQVAGPRGPYAASIKKLVPEHEAASLIGQEVRVRADPDKLDEVMFET